MSAEALSLLGQCALGLAAMTCLSLSMKRHFREVIAHSSLPIKPVSLRWAGWLIIGIMLMSAVAVRGWAQGSVSLLGALSFAAVVVIGVLTYRPAWLSYLAVIGLILGLSIVGVSAL